MLTRMNVTPTIAVKDLNVARNFYADKLGLEPVKETSNEYVQFFKAGNNTIEVYTSEFAGTNKATALTWEVGDDIEKEVTDLKNKGITFEHYNFPETKLEGDVHVMKDMKAAWFKDPDGNILCIHDH